MANSTPPSDRGDQTGSNIIDFDDVRVAAYIERAIDGFLNDPPDSSHQVGDLSCLLTTYREGLGRGGRTGDQALHHRNAARGEAQLIVAEPHRK